MHTTNTGIRGISMVIVAYMVIARCRCYAYVVPLFVLAWRHDGAGMVPVLVCWLQDVYTIPPRFLPLCLNFPGVYSACMIVA
jgi:hypothetical protein